MKDYKLSEIKKICEEHSTDYDRLCGECPLGNGVCKDIENAPATWEIDKKEYKETVVLTREECDSKVILDEDHFERALNYEREKARKEMAKEILTELKNTRFHRGKLTYDFEMAVNKIAKQYGIEVE